jgi:hypothetical protein
MKTMVPKFLGRLRQKATSGGTAKGSGLPFSGGASGSAARANKKLSACVFFFQVVGL